jgi:hypothetical protein
MGQRLRLVRLAAQCLQRIGTTCEFLAQHLDGHVTILWRKVFPVAVQRPVDSSHAAEAKLLLEHIALTQHGPWAHGGTSGAIAAPVGTQRRCGHRRRSGARGAVGELCRQRSRHVAVALNHCDGLYYGVLQTHDASAKYAVR